MKKEEILKSSSFGKRTAEEESNNLEKYFVETDEWRQLFKGEDDIIYGPKGSGKSALYALLSNRKDDLFDRNILLIAAENVSGAPVFRDLVDNPPTSEDELRKLWKLYFASLIGNAFRDYEIKNESAKKLYTFLEDAELLHRNWNLKKVLRAVREYLKYLKPEAIETGVGLDPVSGLPNELKGKIIFSEPSIKQRELGFTSIDDLMRLANKSLSEIDFKIWIVLDRLDVAFVSSEELEGNALRALFRVYLDFQAIEQIALKIFLRDDIWSRISSTGFREASHITRVINIRWNKNTLLNLIVSRLLMNKEVVNYYKLNPDEVLNDIEKQKKIFYRIFPDQIDAGSKKPTAYDWMLSRIVDGTGANVPRELIHLLTAARSIQLKRIETGVDKLKDEQLFSRNSFKEALNEVSNTRLENTLYAEYPDLKPWLEALEGEKTEQYPDTLAKIWNINEKEALKRAKKLTEVGFFEKKGTNQDPAFWTPFLYRNALNLSQGSASI
jgi:hypothetical protein